MIFTPVTAGLYSLMSLGRMGVAWISIVTRAIELLAWILGPEPSAQSNPEPPIERRRYTRHKRVLLLRRVLRRRKQN